MKATGVVRKIDSFGRVVLPKSIRNTLGIADEDSLELFIGDNNEIIWKKYVPSLEIDER